MSSIVGRSQALSWFDTNPFVRHPLPWFYHEANGNMRARVRDAVGVDVVFEYNAQVEAVWAIYELSMHGMSSDTRARAVLASVQAVCDHLTRLRPNGDVYDINTVKLHLQAWWRALEPKTED